MGADQKRKTPQGEDRINFKGFGGLRLWGWRWGLGVEAVGVLELVALGLGVRF